METGPETERHSVGSHFVDWLRSECVWLRYEVLWKGRQVVMIVLTFWQVLFGHLPMWLVRFANEEGGIMEFRCSRKLAFRHMWLHILQLFCFYSHIPKWLIHRHAGIGIDIANFALAADIMKKDRIRGKHVPTRKFLDIASRRITSIAQIHERALAFTDQELADVIYVCTDALVLSDTHAVQLAELYYQAGYRLHRANGGPVSAEDWNRKLREEAAREPKVRIEDGGV